MPRLPIPGSDNSVWGEILNAYLSVSHQSDGLLKPESVSSSAIQNNTIDASKLSAQGGGNGQVLAKDSVSPGGMAWTTVPTQGALDEKADDDSVVKLTGDQTVQGEKIFDSVHTYTTGRLGAGGPAYGPTRIGDSDLQAEAIDTRALNIKDANQNTLAALFGTGSGNTEWAVTTYRSYSGYDHVFRIAGLARDLSSQSGAATLALINESPNEQDVEGIDLFAQRYIGSASDVAETAGMVVLTEGNGQKLPFGFWYKRPGVQEYDRVYGIDPATFRMTVDRQMTLTEGADIDGVVVQDGQVDGRDIAADGATLDSLPNITVSASPPGSPEVGDLWVDTN